MDDVIKYALVVLEKIFSKWYSFVDRRASCMSSYAGLKMVAMYYHNGLLVQC